MGIPVGHTLGMLVGIACHTVESKTEAVGSAEVVVVEGIVLVHACCVCNL